MKSYNVLSATDKKMGAQMAIFVLALGIIFTSYELNSPAYAWWQSLLQNLGAGLLSTLVVIWLYDELLARQAKREANERNRVAASQLIGLLRSQLYGLLFPMYRSAVTAKPTRPIESWEDFLTTRFADQMPHLDLSANSPGSYPMITPYPKFISDNLSAFSKGIQAWVTKYGAFVSPDLIDAAEEVCNSPFIMVGQTLEQIWGFVPPGFPEGLSFGSMFKFEQTTCQDFGVKLTKLIKAVEQMLPAPISKFEDMYWHNACFGIGYARRPEQ